MAKPQKKSAKKLANRIASWEETNKKAVHVHHKPGCMKKVH